MIGDTKGQDVHLPVVCVNDKNKPSDFPQSKWVKEGERYTIVEFARINRMGGVMGVRLAEIDLSDNFPYLFFLADRFGVPEQDLAIENALQKALCTTHLETA